MGDLYKTDPYKRVDPVEGETSSDVSFIAAGVKAAQNSTNGTRRKVLIDLSQAMRCKPRDLDFLFSDHPVEEDPYGYDFPDSERRRRVIRLNNLDAAE